MFTTLTDMAGWGEREMRPVRERLAIPQRGADVTRLVPASKGPDTAHAIHVVEWLAKLGDDRLLRVALF